MLVLFCLPIASLMGASQGGWPVLRTFTNEPFITEQARGLYRTGFSLYPVCNSKGRRDQRHACQNKSLYQRASVS
jgi:hypothetical protein